jgi:hypothetical protein
MLTAFKKVNVILVLAFLYFFTSSADQLFVEISLFRIKVNHILALGLFGLLILGRTRWVFNRALFFTFAATVVSMAISCYFSPYILRSLGYLFVYLFTFLVYFILPYNLVLIYGREKIFSIYKTAFIVTGIIAFIQVALSLFGIVAPFVGQLIGNRIARGQAMTYEPSYFALYMIAFVVYANALYLFAAKSLFSLKQLMKLFAINFMLLLSTSTGAFFSYFIFLGACIGMQSYSWVRECDRNMMKKLVGLATFFCLIFLGIAFTAKDLFLETFWKLCKVGFMAHHSFAERWQGIENAWRIFLENPWFGVGVGGPGPLLYLQRYSKGDSTEFHYPSIETFKLYDPTNVGTELLASLGITGLLTFGLFFLLYFKKFHRLAKQTTLPIKEKGIIYALLVSLIVVLIALQFNQNLFRSYVWIHLAFCLGYIDSLKKVYDEAALS